MQKEEDKAYVHAVSIREPKMVRKVHESCGDISQKVGLQIRVNATSVQAVDEWILRYDEGPRICYIGSPQQSSNSITPGAHSGLEP